MVAFKIRGRNSMVECQLPKLKVASSSLVTRSKLSLPKHAAAPFLT